MSLLTCSSRFLSKHFSFCSSIWKTHLLFILLWLVVLNSSFANNFFPQGEKTVTVMQKRLEKECTLKHSKMHKAKSVSIILLSKIWNLSLYIFFRKTYRLLVFSTLARGRDKGSLKEHVPRHLLRLGFYTAWVWAVRIFWVLTNDL